MPPLKGIPSEFRHNISYGKTTMLGLPECEQKIENMFRRFDTIHQCYGQTDGQRATA